MWKDWLERTLTHNKAPVMLASEILCAEPANNNQLGSALPSDAATRPHADDRADKVPEPAEVQ
jgi:hypothetical protein